MLHDPADPGGAHPSHHVMVIGCGIVGIFTALALRQGGCRVTVIDPGPPGGEQAASYGNGAFITPASIVPMSMPGLWRNVPRYLADPLGPLTIRWRHLPALMPWLVRFLWSGRSAARVRRTARLLHGLLHDGPERHVALAQAHGCGALIRQEGLVYASSKPFMDAGQLRPLLHGGSTRLALIPDTPTVVEVGLSEMAFPVWTGLLAPRRTPAAVVTTLDAAIRSAITDTAIRSRIEAIGGSVLASPPAEFAQLLEQDFPRWQRIIVSRNIRAE